MSMEQWEKDKKESDVYLNEIKQILGLYLIGEPPIEEDAERNTDLMVLKMDAVRVACRVRTNWYLNERNYKNEFTVRSNRHSGTKTELRKIIEGWGDYLFYGFGDEQCKKLEHWHLLDLKVFRSSFYNMVYKGEIPEQIQNKDGSSSFMPFQINDFPGNIIIAKKISSQIIEAA